ncbi:MAG: ABC transporter substrate-binding protein [Kofleriaceae bacterium]
MSGRAGVARLSAEAPWRGPARAGLAARLARKAPWRGPARARLALALALAAVCAARCSAARAETRPRYGGRVEAALLGAPATIDPVQARSHAEISLVGLLFDGLYRLDELGGVAPQLAAGPPILDEARGVVRIPLRPGAIFHDGSAITSAAVAASLERVRASEVAWILSGVTKVNAEGDAIALVGAVDLATLAQRLALPQAGIVARAAPRGDAVIGSGPFSLTSLRRRERTIRLVAFDDYYGGRPYLDEVVLRWFDSPDGEVRRFEVGSSQISLRGVTAFAGAQPKFAADAVDGPAAVLVFVGFGARHADVTGRREVRAALDLALARGGFSALGAGEQVIPTRSVVPPQAGGAALEPWARVGDVAAALAKLHALASGARPLTGQALARDRLEVLIDDSRPDDREVAERVLRALDKLGVAASISALSSTELRARVDRGACDLWIGQLAAPVNDAATWRQLALGMAPAPRGARQGGDAARRLELELPIVPLYFRGLRASHRTDVRGLTFDASGRLGFADLFLFGDPTTPRRKRP